MDKPDNGEGWVEDDFFSALYVALDKLEELDPSTRSEPWFKYLEQAVDKALSSTMENIYKPTRH